MMISSSMKWSVIKRPKKMFVMLFVMVILWSLLHMSFSHSSLYPWITNRILVRLIYLSNMLKPKNKKEEKVRRKNKFKTALWSNYNFFLLLTKCLCKLWYLCPMHMNFSVKLLYLKYSNNCTLSYCLLVRFCVLLWQRYIQFHSLI